MLPAQQLALGEAHPTSSQADQYIISSAGPQSLGATPGYFGISTYAGVIAVRRGMTNVDPFTLPSSDVRGFALQTSRDDWLTMVAAGPMHIKSFSEEPVAAFSPPSGLTTTIRYVTDSGGSGNNQSLEVWSGFNPSAPRPNNDPTNATPILDVLGPQVALWASASRVSNPLGYFEYGQKLPSQVNQSVNASGPEWEVQTPPALPRGWVAETVVLTRAPLFAVRLAMSPVLKTDAPQGPSSVIARRAQVVLTAPNIVKDARALIPKFKAADAHPKIWLRNALMIPKSSSPVPRPTGNQPGEATYQRANVEEEYPPTPPRVGVNVFGPISDLHFAEATGDITLKTTPLSYRALTPIDLRNIRGKGVLQHHMIVPVRIYGDGAQINVVGNADASVNGVPLVRATPEIAQVFSFKHVGEFLGLAAALLALGSGLVVTRVDKHKQPKRRARKQA